MGTLVDLRNKSTNHSSHYFELEYVQKRSSNCWAVIYVIIITVELSGISLHPGFLYTQPDATASFVRAMVTALSHSHIAFWQGSLSSSQMTFEVVVVVVVESF